MFISVREGGIVKRVSGARDWLEWDYCRCGGLYHHCWPYYYDHVHCVSVTLGHMVASLVP